MLVIFGYLLDGILALIFLLVLVYFYFKRNEDYWKKRRVPYAKPEFIFGSYKDSITGKLSFAEILQKIYKEFDDQPYCGIFKYMQPAILLRDPDLIRKVLIEDFSSFHDNDFHLSKETDPNIGRDIFVLKGQQWKAMRTKITTVFTANKIKNMIPSMVDVCKEMIEYLKKEGPIKFGDGVDLKELGSRFTIDVVTSNIFGVSGGCFASENSQFREMAYKVFGERTIWKHFKFILKIINPTLGDSLKIKVVPDEVDKFFRDIVTDLLKSRKSSGEKRNDLLQHLLALKESSDLDQKSGKVDTSKWWNVFTFDDILANIITFFFEGYETSATTISLILFELSQRKDIQQRLREEVKETLQQNNGTFTYDSLHGMKYMEMVFLETLRKNPVGYFMSKSCTEPYQLPTPTGGKVLIEKGTPMVIPLYSLQHDPSYFPNPEVFDPERFNEENLPSINKMTYFPFGEGPRICIGMKFAKTQIKVAVSHILLNFELTKSNNTEYPCQLDPKSFIFNAKNGLRANFVEIKT